MFQSRNEQLSNLRDFRLFILASVFMGLGACVNSSAFNNYLHDRYALDMVRRTFLEIPREMPGFLVSLFVGLLAALGDIRIAGLAQIAASLGMLALGWIPPNYVLMLGMLFIYSSGTHVYMPLGNSIGMSFSETGNEGRTLGKVQASTTLALVLGAGALLLAFKYLNLGYRLVFTLGSLCYAVSGLFLFSLSPRPKAKNPTRFVFNPAYSRFYLLSILYGARKQLFLTFGPWMLVDLFKQPVATMSLLFFVVSTGNVFMKPAVGRWTDRFGPAKILLAEALFTIVICLLYAFSPLLLPWKIALTVVCLCYVADQMADSVAMTRAIYVKSIVKKPEDLSPTLSLGISIDHIISMVLPVAGSMLWLKSGSRGYMWIFLGGAVVALINAAVSLSIAKTEKNR